MWLVCPRNWVPITKHTAADIQSFRKVNNLITTHIVRTNKTTSYLLTVIPDNYPKSSSSSSPNSSSYSRYDSLTTSLKEAVPTVYALYTWRYNLECAWTDGGQHDSRISRIRLCSLVSFYLYTTRTEFFLQMAQIFLNLSPSVQANVWKCKITHNLFFFIQENSFSVPWNIWIDFDIYQASTWIRHNKFIFTVSSLYSLRIVRHICRYVLPHSPYFQFPQKFHYLSKNCLNYTNNSPMPEAALSKAEVCGR
jgi:hypothetical protein